MTATADGARAIAPVRKQLRVRVAPGRAFAAFTAGIAGWWPLDTHSVFEDQAVSMVFGSAPGAPIVEVSATGETSALGMVVAWEPPSRVVFTWHPAREPAWATEVEVTFVADDEGTLVSLEHRAWERRPDAERVRPSYVEGWSAVLARYQAALGGPVEVADPDEAA
jgi:uncharacterized protein YndB with AHSA1/START domain